MLYLTIVPLGQKIPDQSTAMTLLIPKQVLVEQQTVPPPHMILLKTIELKEAASQSFTQIDLNLQRIGQVALNALTATLVIFLIWQITLANLDSLKRMAGDPDVINEYANDDYSVCAYIGTVTSQGQRVYIYSPDGMDLCATDRVDGWYFSGHQPEIHHVMGEFISPTILVPGDLVVVGARNRGLTNAEISQLIDLGRVTDSLTSLQFSNKDLRGRTTAASICFKCDALASGQD